MMDLTAEEANIWKQTFTQWSHLFIENRWKYLPVNVYIHLNHWAESLHVETNAFGYCLLDHLQQLDPLRFLQVKQTKIQVTFNVIQKLD